MTWKVFLLWPVAIVVVCCGRMADAPELVPIYTNSATSELSVYKSVLGSTNGIYSVSATTNEDPYINSKHSGFVIGKKGMTNYIPFLSIAMPCGSNYVVNWGDTLPTNSVPCTCGRTNHWFIEFKDYDK